MVVALRVAEQYAADEGMKFRTPSLKPRNPKNEPTEFERRALEAFAKDASLKEYSERASVDGKEMMRYAQPVRIARITCSPRRSSGRKDPFGYPKEGRRWRSTSCIQPGGSCEYSCGAFARQHAGDFSGDLPDRGGGDCGGIFCDSNICDQTDHELRTIRGEDRQQGPGAARPDHHFGR